VAFADQLDGELPYEFGITMFSINVVLLKE